MSVFQARCLVAAYAFVGLVQYGLFIPAFMGLSWTALFCAGLSGIGSAFVQQKYGELAWLPLACVAQGIMLYGVYNYVGWWGAMFQGSTFILVLGALMIVPLETRVNVLMRAYGYDAYKA